MVDDDPDILDHGNSLTLADLSRVCNVDLAWLEDFIAQGALHETGTMQFSALSIVRVRRARRLQRDFDLNAAGAALVLDLLDELERLRGMVR